MIVAGRSSEQPRSSVITAEPQDHLPYGYGITVERLTAANAYREV
ncbi:MAG TPA: hypothetical protein VGG10_19920 [Rhizomicrobium sp.]